MRVVALLGAVLLSLSIAGCTQGDPGGGDGNGFEATCPSWVKGPDVFRVDGNMVLTNRTTFPDLERWDLAEPSKDSDRFSGFGDGVLERMGHPLDFLVMDFTFKEGGQQDSRLLYIQDAELHVEFFASDNGGIGRELSAALEGQPETAKHEWVFRTEPGGYRIENLTWRVELSPSDQAPAPAGVLVHWFMVPNLDGNIDTASVVLMRYAPELWYRTCSADGTKT